MPWFLRVSSSSRNSCHGFLTVVSVYHTCRLRARMPPQRKYCKFDIPTLNFNLISRRRPLELDQIIVGAVGGEQGACMLKVLALCLTLECLVARSCCM